MPPPLVPRAHDACSGVAGPWRRRLWSGLVALALTVPNVTYSQTLQQLLLLPLERLLQLEFSPRHTLPRAAGGRAGHGLSLGSLDQGGHHHAV